MLYNGSMYKDKEKRKEAVASYNAKTYEQWNIRIRKDEADDIRQAIGSRSVNGFVNEAIREKIAREKTK